MMSNEIVKSEVGEILKLDDLTLTKEQIKQHFTPGASDDELAVFIMTANAWGLNPIKKEIMFVKYGDHPGTSVINYQVPIKRAEASGELEGYTVDYKGQGDGAVCTVTVYRKGWKAPFVHEVTYREVAYGHRKDGGTYLKSAGWKAQPTFMHKKTTINQAFKLAFPSLLGNMPYIEGEVPLAGGTVEAEYEIVKDPIGGKDRIDAVDDSDLPWQDGRTAIDDLELFMQAQYPGKENRAAAKEMLVKCFGTHAWTKIKALGEDAIRTGYEKMKRLLNGEVETTATEEVENDTLDVDAAESGEEPSHDETLTQDFSPSPESTAIIAKMDKRLKNLKQSATDVADFIAWTGYNLDKEPDKDPFKIQGNIDNKEWKVAMQGIRNWYDLSSV